VGSFPNQKKKFENLSLALPWKFLLFGGNAKGFALLKVQLPSSNFQASKIFNKSLLHFFTLFFSLKIKIRTEKQQSYNSVPIHILPKVQPYSFNYYIIKKCSLVRQKSGFGYPVHKTF
jgi:hypothetical protein